MSSQFLKQLRDLRHRCELASLSQSRTDQGALLTQSNVTCVCGQGAVCEVRAGVGAGERGIVGHSGQCQVCVSSALSVFTLSSSSGLTEATGSSEFMSVSKAYNC